MIEFLSSFSTVLLALLMILLISVIFKKRDKRLAPGPLPLPFIGNLLQIAWANSKEPHIAFAKLGEKYGNIMSIQLGSVYSVVFNSFDVMEEYLTKSEFSDRYCNGWIAERTFQKRLGLAFAPYPSPWQELRRFSVRKLREFGLGKRSTMELIIHAELKDVVKDIKTRIGGGNGGIINFDGYFMVSTLNMVWSMLTGTRYMHNDPKLVRLANVVDIFFQSSNSSTNILMAFPEWRDFFPNLTGMTVQRVCFQETNSFFQETVDERKRLGVYKTKPENMIDGFLHELEEQAKQDGTGDEKIFTEEQLVALMNDLFMAGSETTSNTLAWCILYLIRNPEVQGKLQREIDAVIPDGGFPTAEHEPQLHYVRATLAETHRIASVLALMIPRASTEDTYCGSFLIPKGTYVLTNLYNIHHENDYWNDPENFRPDRFIDSNGHFKSDPRLKPFGFGRRACVGEPLASIALLHFLTVLMQNFTFSLVPNEPVPSVEPVVGLTNGPKKYRALVKCRQ
ncbi:unnamed protein product [Orchesella dallaii]|uniref:Methyl farnesoate epoxidase n=1 Tax=Orchesella dallaii TaxID=48710 RepID=A0ABP1R7B6_9HEXA